ncbi:exportin-5-like [Convolutriloba macropyga]|uniref:exportin-5-like n=1 Tax=Convolutriloba macropyga TaxID=536237 RepID=UPI003F51E9A7
MDESDEAKVMIAYKTSLNPSTSNLEKQNAFHFLETFKHQSDKCLAIGSSLIRSPNLYEKTLGFELLHCFVQESWTLNDWNSASLKAKFKWEILLHVQNDQTISENRLLVNAVTKLFVLMFLQEFPQNWPDLLPTLFNIMEMSRGQKILVFAIFQRVSEDLIISACESIPSNRTKDIRQFLSRASNLEPVFRVCHDDMRHALETKSSPDIGLITAEITLMQQILEWVPCELISQFNIRELLLNLLSIKIIRMQVADCIVALLQRKPSDISERALLLSFFKISALRSFRSAIEMTKLSDQIEDDCYIFLKKVLELYITMNDVYANIQSKFVNELSSITPEEHNTFLENLFTLLLVPSHFLHLEVLYLLVQNLKSIVKNPNKASYLQKVSPMYQIALFVLVKVGFPSKSNHPSCRFAGLDFDDDLEFGSYVGQLRSGGCDLIKCLVDLDFSTVSQILIGDFTKTINQWYSEGQKDPLLCHYLEAKAVALCSFLAKTLPKEETEAVVDLKTRLQNIFVFCLEACEREKNASILNSLLSVVSSLFSYWFQSQEIFVRVIKLIFNTMQMVDFDCEEDSKKACLLHRHCSSLFLSKVIEHYDLFIPFYNDFFPILSSFLFNEEIDKMCRASMLESIVILTAYIDEPFRSETLQKLLHFSIDKFNSIVQEHCQSVDSFLRLTSICNYGEKFEYYDQMIELKFSTSLVNGLFRRFWNALERKQNTSDKKDVPEKAVLIKLASDAAKMVTPHAIAVICRLHDLHESAIKSSFCDQLKGALELSEQDRRMILGIQLPVVEALESVGKTPLDKIQNYFKELHSNTIQTLCSAALVSLCEQEQNFKLIELMLEALFCKFDCLSNVCIAGTIKYFLAPIKDKCPESLHASILIPIFKFSFPKIFERLNRDWTALTSRPDATLPGFKDPESGDTSEEALEDLFIRRNSRAIISIIESSCIVLTTENVSQKTEGPNVNQKNNDSEMNDATPRLSSIPSIVQCRHELKNFGQMVVNDESLYESVLLILVNAFVWPDTAACSKSIDVFWTLFQPMMQRECSENVIGLIFAQMLKGYQVHEYSNSSSAQLSSLILKFFVSLRPRYPILRTILNQVPESNADLIDEFEKKVQLCYAEKKETLPSEKKMKEMMRKILKGVVGRPTSRMYQKKILVNKLPRLAPMVKTEIEPDLDTQSLFQFF